MSRACAEANTLIPEKQKYVGHGKRNEHTFSGDRVEVAENKEWIRKS